MSTNFGSSSGLAEKFTGQILHATFGIDSRIGDGKVLLLKLDIEDQDTGDVYQEIVKAGQTVNRKTGAQEWQPHDGGLRVQHATSPKRQINKNTQLGKWAQMLIGNGLPEHKGPDGKPFVTKNWEKFVEYLGSNDGNFEDGTPRTERDARTFIGTIFYFDRKTEPWSMEGKSGVNDVLYPFEFIGLAGEAGSQGGMDPELEAKLVTAAKAAANFGAFQSAILDIPEVQNGGSDLVDKLVRNDSEYQRLKAA